MYRKSIYALILGLVMISFPAFALADAGPYLGIHGLATFAEDSDAGIVTDAEYDTGFGGGVTLGYQYGPRYSSSRTELELSYRTNEIDDIKVFNMSASPDGDVNVLSLMANALYVFDNETPVKPYFMGGLGAAWMEIDKVKADNILLADDDEIDFAYQLGVGIDFWLSQNLCIDVGYRYFKTDTDGLKNEVGDKFDFEYETNNASLGLRYTF